MINLLPNENKEKYRVISKVYEIAAIYLFLLVLVGLGATALFTYNFTKNSAIQAKQTTLDGLNASKQKNSAVANEAAFLQDRVSSSTAYKDIANWSGLLGTIASDTPTGIQLTGTKVTTAKGTAVELDGQSTDPRQIILYQQKLAEETSFTGVQILSMNQSADGGYYAFVITFGVKNVAH